MYFFQLKIIKENKTITRTHLARIAGSGLLCNIIYLINIISKYGLYSQKFFRSNSQIDTLHKIFYLQHTHIKPFPV